MATFTHFLSGWFTAQAFSPTANLDPRPPLLQLTCNCTWPANDPLVATESQYQMKRLFETLAC